LLLLIDGSLTLVYHNYFTNNLSSYVFGQTSFLLLLGWQLE